MKQQSEGPKTTEGLFFIVLWRVEAISVTLGGLHVSLCWQKPMTLVKSAKLFGFHLCVPLTLLLSVHVHE